MGVGGVGGGAGKENRQRKDGSVRDGERETERGKDIKMQTEGKREGRGEERVEGMRKSNRHITQHTQHWYKIYRYKTNFLASSSALTSAEIFTITQTHASAFRHLLSYKFSYCICCSCVYSFLSLDQFTFVTNASTSYIPAISSTDRTLTS